MTWKDAGKGIREVFTRLVEGIDLREDIRVREVEVLANGKKRVHDEHDGYIDVDRVVFACPANAVGNIYKKHGILEDVILATPGKCFNSNKFPDCKLIAFSARKVVPFVFKTYVLCAYI